MRDPENLLVSREFIADCKSKYGVDFIRMLDLFTKLYFDGKEPTDLTADEASLFAEKRDTVLRDGILE